jgi:SagB-type dehydrogenase family enzyme
LLVPSGKVRTRGAVPIADIILPRPAEQAGSLLRVLHQRRSIRDFSRASLTLADAAALLWAAQGVTHPDGLRTAPSAGALYPLETFLVAQRVEDLPIGVYHYLPDGHALAVVPRAGTPQDLAAAALGQECVERAAAVIVFTAEPVRTTRKYGERGLRYVHLEAGHAAQNVCLAAVALGLGTVVVGAFDDDGVRRVLRPVHVAEPLCLVAVGRPA